MDSGEVDLSFFCRGERPPFPSHWKNKPMIVTADMVRWPAPYGTEPHGDGSTTMRNWIAANMKRDQESGMTREELEARARAEDQEENVVVSGRSSSTNEAENRASPASSPPRAHVKSRNKSNAFPKHWTGRPTICTKDIVQWPGGYGSGSSTMKKWIRKNMRRDKWKERCTVA